MHPALSIIVFTTASGAGFGLLAWLGLGAGLGRLPRPVALAAPAMALALALVTLGLLASTAHLGRPERAWRAFSQWRTSWLSREGIMALVTYAAAMPFGATWLLDTANPTLGLLTAAAALGTLVCTGMIYASLKPIPAWHNVWTVPSYLALGLAAGAVLFASLTGLVGVDHSGLRLLSAGCVALAWAVKEAYWHHLHTTPPSTTAASATGLAHRGEVRLFEAPHTERNYLLREMGFRVARKHRTRLRALTRVAFALALVLGLVPWALAPAIAALVLALGVLIERWLFFAEATHTVMLYYGAARV